MRVPALPDGAAFLGIPYAAAPVGALRWQPPRPARAWIGVRKTVQYGPACPQVPANWLPYPVWSEDCLFLNIWTSKPSSAARLPVIVYFHGGGNVAGYGQLTPLGPPLARLGVVVVTANYRLGPFGFFAHPALTAASPHESSGNYGLLDQIALLRWVRSNISAFGGDPKRVTVMGQSAGGFDICLLMTSPLARGLFHAAIVESGDCESALLADMRTPIHFSGIEGSGYSNGERLAADLGVKAGPGAVRSLRAISAARILSVWRHDPRLQFGAIVDGWVIRKQPASVFARGEQARVPVLVGSNADEATVFGPGPQTLADYWKYLRHDTGPFAKQEFRLWPAYSNARVHREFLELQSGMFAYGAWSMARSMARIDEPSYLYRLTWVDAGKRAPLGAEHGEELYFLSDRFPGDWQPMKDQGRFGEMLRRYWTDFAKTGHPSAPGLPGWPAFDSRSHPLLELGSQVRPMPVSPELQRIQTLMRPILEPGTMVDFAAKDMR